MYSDLQKASVLKRFAAMLIDLILLVIVATGCLLLLNSALDYDSYYNQLEQITQDYADQYGIRADMTAEEFAAMSQSEQEAYTAAVKAADEAINADTQAVELYNTCVNLTLAITTGAILMAVVLLEFVMPLILGNGQTVGKKIFSLCLVRKDGVKLTNIQLFTRTVLGKFAVGIMIPAYAFVMLMLNILGGVVLLVTIGLLLLQVICVVVSKNNCALHDMLAGTVVVDYASQRIFKTTDDLIAYQKKMAAERASRQPY